MQTKTALNKFLEMFFLQKGSRKFQKWKDICNKTCSFDKGPNYNKSQKAEFLKRKCFALQVKLGRLPELLGRVMTFAKRNFYLQLDFN